MTTPTAGQGTGDGFFCARFEGLSGRQEWAKMAQVLSVGALNV
jgi:hypothetical protein